MADVTVDNGDLTDYGVSMGNGTVDASKTQRVTIASDSTGTVAVTDGGGSLTVDAASLPLPSGAATAAKQPALGTAGTASTDVLSVQGIASGTALAVSDGGGSLTVDGTVAVSGTVPVSDGGGSVTVDGTVAATQSGTWNVGTVTTVTNVVHVDDNASTLSVDDGGGSLTVDGTVTVNAGTNLNTSALATETGGNLAAAATSLGVMDDWDESDRAKVNLIVGQAGVQGGSGVVSALTQRVVLATDVALPSPATVGTATLSNVNDTASSTSLLASNASRKGVILHNDSTSDLYLKYGATASATSYTYKVPAAGHWEMPAPVYTGAIDGIWSADASGAARLTEMS